MITKPKTTLKLSIPIIRKIPSKIKTIPINISSNIRLIRISTLFRPRFRQPSAADLCIEVPCMTTDQTNDKVMEVFNRHRDLVSLPVVEGNQPIGLINRSIFLSQMSKQFRQELYGRKSCIAF